MRCGPWLSGLPVCCWLTAPLNPTTNQSLEALIAVAFARAVQLASRQCLFYSKTSTARNCLPVLLHCVCLVTSSQLLSVGFLPSLSWPVRGLLQQLDGHSTHACTLCRIALWCHRRLVMMSAIERAAPAPRAGLVDTASPNHGCGEKCPV